MMMDESVRLYTTFTPRASRFQDYEVSNTEIGLKSTRTLHLLPLYPMAGTVCTGPMAGTGCVPGSGPRLGLLSGISSCEVMFGAEA